MCALIRRNSVTEVGDERSVGSHNLRVKLQVRSPVPHRGLEVGTGHAFLESENWSFSTVLME